MLNSRPTGQICPAASSPLAHMHFLAKQPAMPTTQLILFKIYYLKYTSEEIKTVK